jgi:outer membrane protein TolC
LVPLILAACLGIAGTPGPGREASAQESAGEASEPDTSYLAGEAETSELGISLEQAQRLAAAGSPATRAALAALRTARGARMKEAGPFDPVLIGASERLSADTPVTSPFAASESRARSLSGGISWLSPIGTAASVTLSQVQLETNAPFSTLPRERHARARFDFVQPLLQGFGPAATRGELNAAERELEAAERTAEAAALDLGAEVENAYWELYAAERDLAVQRLQRQRAAVFLRDQLSRSRAGVVGPGAVATARTFLAQQEASLIDKRIAVGSASDRLAQVMGESSAAGGPRYHCLDEVPGPSTVEPLEVMLQRAIKGSPSLLAAEQAVLAARARARQAAGNAWPSLEAFGGYGGSGLAGTGRRIVFGTDTLGTDFDTGFGDAWSDVFDDRNPDWNLGIRVRMPIGWRSDRGERERQAGLYEQAQESLRARRLALETDVRRAHREAELSQRALAAMRDLVEAAEEQARISRLEYQAGRSTAYALVNVETDLAEAKFGESQMLVRVARAATELRRLTTPVSRRTQ